MRRALFLDRDGVITQLVWYPASAGAEALVPREWSDGLQPVENANDGSDGLTPQGMEHLGEWEGPRTVGEIEIIAGVPAALEKAHKAGWLLFVVTNQPSYAKGKVSRVSLDRVHAAALHGLPIEKSYVCFHHPEAIVDALRVRCGCRKPAPGALFDAADEFGLDLSESWMVGDQDSDIGTARAAGCRAALIENPRSAYKRGKLEPDERFATLAEFIGHVVDSADQ